MAATSTVHIHIESATDVVAARSRVRELAEQIGLSALDCTSVVAAVSELARNVLAFAQQGDLELSCVEDGGVCGLKIEAIDQGPGIEDVPLAMQDGYSTCGGLGMGLPGTRRLMDEFHILSQPGKGTRITVVKWRR